jgi:hypothetical protein
MLSLPPGEWPESEEGSEMQKEQKNQQMIN